MNEAGMNQDIRESLSAGIDGELSGEQLRFLLRRLDHDVALQQAWDRYHVAGDGLRRQLPVLASDGFAAKVMNAIVQDAGAAAPRRSHWLRWSAGGAIAASVAAAALMLGTPAAGDKEQFAAARSQPADAPVTAIATGKPVAPASVPPWLSGSSAGLLSQQASATMGAPFSQARSTQVRRLSTYPAMPRYRTLDNNDGSYLLLLDPGQQRLAPENPRREAVAQ